jgi:hypothetical protein
MTPQTPKLKVARFLQKSGANNSTTHLCSATPEELNPSVDSNLSSEGVPRIA